MQTRGILAIIVIILMGAVNSPAGEGGRISHPAGARRPVTVRVGNAKHVLVDINSASRGALMSVPGIGSYTATRIISGRPYKMKNQLKTRHIVSVPLYDRIAERIIARQPKR